ncbi:hypothetical protein HAX54_027386, partial [Datura stramonium]|nr:hypothetical protein [Datura stramonium]
EVESQFWPFVTPFACHPCQCRVLERHVAHANALGRSSCSPANARRRTGASFFTFTGKVVLSAHFAHVQPLGCSVASLRCQGIFATQRPSASVLLPHAAVPATETGRHCPYHKSSYDLWSMDPSLLLLEFSNGSSPWAVTHYDESLYPSIATELNPLNSHMLESHDGSSWGAAVVL